MSNCHQHLTVLTRLIMYIYYVLLLININAYNICFIWIWYPPSMLKHHADNLLFLNGIWILLNCLVCFHRNNMLIYVNLMFMYEYHWSLFIFIARKLNIWSYSIGQSNKHSVLFVFIVIDACILNCQTFFCTELFFYLHWIKIIMILLNSEFSESFKVYQKWLFYKSVLF